VDLDLSHSGPPISPLLFGHNLEHTRYAVWHGLGAQILANSKFAGPPRAEGLAADWAPVGAPRAGFHLDSVRPYAGTQSQRITLDRSGSDAGLAQGSLPLLQGRAYELKVALRSEEQLRTTIRITGHDGRTTHMSESVRVEPGDWRESSFTFTPARTDAQARLEVTFNGPGALWVGAVSLMPADHFHGMRRDVVDLMAAMSPPLLRWPGGNFVRDYRWKEGLLPPGRRPPILSTWRSTLPYSHSHDFHEIATDEFMELCQYLRAEPCLTVNLDPKFAPPGEAAAWVEYCNGGTGTRWGAVRAARGHREPYRVRYWFIGNEVWGHWMGPTHSDASSYARRLASYAAAMKQVDPSIVLVASGQGAIAPEEGAKWDEILLREAGMHFDVLSQHHYAPALPWCAGPDSDPEYARRMREAVDGLLPAGPQAEQEFARLSHYATSEMLPLLRNVRRAIEDRAAGRHIGIALDEWNVWHNWFTRPAENPWYESVTEAVWAAGMIHMMCREAEPLGLTLGAFFQPVNEGAIAVEPFSARLTPLGQVFALLSVHQGGRMLQARESRPGSSLDLCCSLSKDGGNLHLTIINRDPYRQHRAELAFTAPTLAGAAAPFRLYTAPRLTPWATFEERTELLEVNRAGRVQVTLPRYSVGLLRIALPDATTAR
jgi:alpha-N-arabinofuranosidase